MIGGRTRDRSGVTLLELIIVLAILGGMAAFVGLSLGSQDPEGWNQPPDGRTEAISAVRRKALDSGRPVETILEADEGPVPVTALPDGRLVGGEAVGWDPLSGRRRNGSGADVP